MINEHKILLNEPLKYSLRQQLLRSIAILFRHSYSIEQHFIFGSRAPPPPPKKTGGGAFLLLHPGAENPSYANDCACSNAQVLEITDLSLGLGTCLV